MAAIVDHRVCAEIEGEFVLFLIGVRINRPWKLGTWLPVLRAMPRMLAELDARPDLGLLHHRTHLGVLNAMVVQYWRSVDQLQAYALARERHHLPAWTAFNRAVGTSGDVGIWHETYVIGPGRAESIYANMPPYGMGRAGRILPAQGRRADARARLSAGAAQPPAAIRALHHVQLAMPAGGEAQARDFYERLLGLGEVAKPPHLARRGGCWFEAGEIRVHLGVEAEFRPARKAHPAFLVEDVRGMAARLASAGVRVTEDEPLDGFDRVYIEDPFGNRIELMQVAVANDPRPS